MVSCEPGQPVETSAKGSARRRIIALGLSGRRPEGILAGGDSHRFASFQSSAPAGRRRIYLPDSRVPAAPSGAAFLCGGLPVVSPPANFLMALRAMKSPNSEFAEVSSCPGFSIDHVDPSPYCNATYDLPLESIFSRQIPLLR